MMLPCEDESERGMISTAGGRGNEQTGTAGNRK
jgi:hypothetical protein